MLTNELKVVEVPATLCLLPAELCPWHLPLRTQKSQGDVPFLTGWWDLRGSAALGGGEQALCLYLPLSPSPLLWIFSFLRVPTAPCEALLYARNFAPVLPASDS